MVSNVLWKKKQMTIGTMIRRVISWGVIFACLFFALSGCGGKKPYVQEFSDGASIKRRNIAVLPFSNRSGYGQGDKILYRLFLVELVQQCNWRVALEGDVFKIYRQMRLKPWDVPDYEQLRVIAVRLGVDTLIVGEVLEMDEKVTQGGVSPALSLQVRVYDGKSGLLQWSSLYRREGGDYQKMMHFGMVNTVSELGKKMVQEILGVWKEKGLMACADS
jgi:hypothetical protein